MKRYLTVFLASAMALCVLPMGDTTIATVYASDETTTSSGDNEITIGIPQDLDDSLDPYMMTAAGTREVMFNVFEGLVKIAPDGSYVDAVASAHSVSDDGLTYTFTLRDGVVFHNGDTVTPEDVLYSFETCAATTVNASVAAALSAVTVTAEGNDIIVTLPEENSDFLAYASNVFIVPDDYTEQATAPVGTGPFAFESRSVQENVVLVKNKDYYGTPAYLDQVTIKIFADSNSELTALDSGSLDLVAHLNSDQIATLTNGYNVLDSTMNLAVALYLNNDVEPLNDMRVRQALSYAINVDEVMAFASGGNGVKIGSSMFPLFTKYFDPSLADAYAQDVDKARELLTEAGYPDGFSFSVTVASEYEHPYGDMAMVMAEELKAIGVNLEIKYIDWSSWLSDVYTNRDFESTIVGFDAAVLTAGAMLERWTTGAGTNMINYSNEDYDAAYAAALACKDDEEQTGYYKECLKILSDTAANVYIQDLPEYVVINPELEGYQFYPLYILDMSTVRYAE